MNWYPISFGISWTLLKLMALLSCKIIYIWYLKFKKCDSTMLTTMQCVKKIKSESEKNNQMVMGKLCYIFHFNNQMSILLSNVLDTFGFSICIDPSHFYTGQSIPCDHHFWLILNSPFPNSLYPGFFFFLSFSTALLSLHDQTICMSFRPLHLAWTHCKTLA